MSSKSGNHRSNAVVATNPQIVSLGYVVGENNPAAVTKPTESGQQHASSPVQPMKHCFSRAALSRSDMCPRVAICRLGAIRLVRSRHEHAEHLGSAIPSPAPRRCGTVQQRGTPGRRSHAVDHKQPGHSRHRHVSLHQEAARPWSWLHVSRLDSHCSRRRTQPP